MKLHKNTKGIALVELLAVLAIIGLIISAVWFVNDRRSSESNVDNNNVSIQDETDQNSQSVSQDAEESDAIDAVDNSSSEVGNRSNGGVVVNDGPRTRYEFIKANTSFTYPEDWAISLDDEESFVTLRNDRGCDIWLNRFILGSGVPDGSTISYLTFAGRDYTTFTSYSYMRQNVNEGDDISQVMSFCPSPDMVDDELANELVDLMSTFENI